MRWVVLALVACGGKPPPPPPKPADPPPAPVAKRVPIEDDSEQEDGVKFVNARGHMDPKAVEAGIAPHTDELSDCYMTRVGQRRWLGGHVQLRWDIKRDGTIKSVKLVDSDLGAREIEKCLVDTARAATFDKPIGGDADFALPLDFSAKGMPVSWDEDESLKAVGGQLAKLDVCAKTAKPERPPRDVTITVYVGPRGKALSVGFSSAKSEIGDKWADCAEKAALAWRLPDPKGQVAKLAVRFR